MPTIYEVVANWVAEDSGEPFLPRTEPVRPSVGEQWDEWMRQLGNMWEIPSQFARIPTRPNWWNQLSNSEAVRRFRHQQRQEMMMYGDGSGVEPTAENAPYSVGLEDVLDVQRRFNAVFNDVERAARLGDGSGELAYRGGQPVGLPPRPDHYRVRGGQCACGFENVFTGDMDLHIQVSNIGASGPTPADPAHE